MTGAATPAPTRRTIPGGRSGRPARRPRDGFIIVATLWILVALATLVSIYAVYVINTATAVATTEDRPQVEAQVIAALELTAYRLTALEAAARPTSGAFRLRLGPAEVAVQFQSEAARIDLNAASKELLAGLFGSFGVPPPAAEEYATRIVAWRSPARPGNPEMDEETTLYRAAGRPYAPRHGPFVHVGELWLVLGLPPALIERALPHVTVFSGQAAVDVLDAAPQVIAALPGMTPDLLATVLNARSTGATTDTLLQMLGPARAGATVAPVPAVRVSVLVRGDNGRQNRCDAVILLRDGADEPYRILSWHSDFDDALRSGQ